MGIYNDDGLSGTIMEVNFFLEAGRTTFIGGGVDSVVKNNVYVKCYSAITVDSPIWERENTRQTTRWIGSRAHRRTPTGSPSS